MFASLFLYILITSQFLSFSNALNTNTNIKRAIENGKVTVDWLSKDDTKLSYKATPRSDSVARMLCYEEDLRPAANVFWMSTCFNMEIEVPYRIYYGHNQTEVYDNYHSKVFSLQRFVFGDFSWVCFKSLDEFCIIVDTHKSFTIELEIDEKNARYLETFFVTLVFYFLADFLSKSNIIQLILGTISGVIFFSFLICYVVTRTFPQKPQWAFMAFLCSSGSLTVFVRWLFNNTLDTNNLTIITWYMLITGIISFVICYISGPVENQRVQNVFKWFLQAVCLLVIYHCLPSHFIAMTVVIALAFVSFILQFAYPAYHRYQLYTRR